MRKARTLITAVLLACSGCTSSVYPLATCDDVVTDERIEGAWVLYDQFNKRLDAKTTLTIKATNSKTYRVIAKDEKRQHAYDAKLVQIGEHLYVDLLSNEYHEKLPIELAFNSIPIHQFARIKLDDKALYFKCCEASRVRKLVKDEDADIPYLDDAFGCNIVLTASTKNLQKILRQHGDAILAPQYTEYRKQ